MPFDPNKSDPIIVSDEQRRAMSLGNQANMGVPPNTFNAANMGAQGGINIGVFIALLGCFIPILIVGFFIYDGFFAADLNPKSIHGTFTDGTIIPAGKNAGKLFFIMDDSFYYTSEVSSPGSHSISTESLFNKTYSYIYDAPKNEVSERTRNTYGGKLQLPSFNIGDLYGQGRRNSVGT